jgi:hypothetical protein
MREQILARVREVTVGTQISCANAHRIAKELGVPPAAVGEVVNNVAGLRFYRCQMGFFGYGVKAEGTHRIVQPAANVPPEVRAALEPYVVDGRIPCVAAWEVADRLEYPYLAMANVLERLGYRVKPCQLGCF